MSVPYKRITVKSVTDDENAILAVLAGIQAKRLRDDLACLNYYQDFPINYGADILSIDRGFVELIITRTQAIVMAEQRITFLKSEHFPHTVLAMVERVTIEREHAFVSRFSYVTLEAERRRSIRIDMGGSLYVDFQSQLVAARARVFKLALGGIELGFDTAPHFNQHSRGVVTLSFQEQNLKAPVKFLRTIPGKYEKVFVFIFETSDESDKFIYRMLLHREKVLLRSIRDAITEY